jgi:hypothetical protein
MTSRKILEKMKNLWKFAKLSVFQTFRVFSIFRPQKRFKKTQGTHILDHLEILYQMVYDNQKKNLLYFCFAYILFISYFSSVRHRREERKKEMANIMQSHYNTQYKRNIVFSELLYRTKEKSSTLLLFHPFLILTSFKVVLEITYQRMHQWNTRWVFSHLAFYIVIFV